MLELINQTCDLYSEFIGMAAGYQKLFPLIIVNQLLNLRDFLD